MRSDSSHFYLELIGKPDFDDFFTHPEYQPVPGDWLVVIADIKGSGKAVSEGRYKDVNAMGAASIVAAVKATETTDIPYVFGGDGASFAVPPSVKNEILVALHTVKKIAQRSFQLDLRIGCVPVSVIRHAGYDVLIGKYQPTPSYEQAMFSGGGLNYAESLIKNDSADNPYRQHCDPGKPKRNLLDGFECRWDEIPGSSDEVISLLVQRLETADESTLYPDLLARIHAIYGKETDYHPINEAGMHLTTESKKLRAETQIHTGFLPWHKRIFYMTYLKLQVLLGRYLMKHKIKTQKADWGQYKKTFIQNTDFQRFDDMLRLMISGTPSQREALEAYLETLRTEQKIVYGINVSTHSLVTCMISDYNEQHVHFVDGKDGGYTLAAEQLKGQLRLLDST